jgi:hypothetical protein
MAMLNSRQALREQSVTVNTANASALRSDQDAKSFASPLALQDRPRGVEVTVQHDGFRSVDYKPYYHDMKGPAV